MITLIRPALMLMAFFTFLTGLAYPVLVTVTAQAVFPDKANGSLVTRNGKVVGSTLIGQNFTAPEYFWGRLSATGSFPYNAMASSGSNYAAMHPALAEAAKSRAESLQAADSLATPLVPGDLATASGSGLDPEISVAAAEYQARRIAIAREIPMQQVHALICKHRQGKFLGFSGLERVNVLELNLALDARASL